MTRLLATTAIALVALSGAASAQSVLERVLGQINGATNQNTLNGTFANIAENIGGGSATLYVDNNGNSVSEDTYNQLLATAIESAENSITFDDDAGGEIDGEAWTYAGTEYATLAAAQNAAANAAANALAAQYNPLEVGIADGINGSINNTIDGIGAATQQAIASSVVSAIEWNMPTFDFGDMATTALGAVNTGEITLGVNSAVDEAKTSTTNAISAVVDQIGGSADTSAIILNVASNMTGVNGSINNTMSEINGSLGNLSTTALGAVNTGTIISGVDAAVAGIVGSSTGGSNGL